MRKSLVIPSLASLAIAMAASAAGAQTVISRTISPHPVETVVAQTPTGTIVPRRPVDAPVVAQPTLVQPGIVAPAIAAPVLPAPGAVEADAVDAIMTREVVRRAEAMPTTREMMTPTPRRMVTRDVAARPAVRTQRRAVRTTKTTTTRIAPAPASLVLNPRERQIVYRTIVEREVIPRQQVVVAPAALPSLYARPVAAPARAPVVAGEEVVVLPAAITVGSVLPESVPLYAIPQNVALSVPATRPYSYAYLGGRAYLVDPATGAVMADVTED